MVTLTSVCNKHLYTMLTMQKKRLHGKTLTLFYLAKNSVLKRKFLHK